MHKPTFKGLVHVYRAKGSLLHGAAVRCNGRSTASPPRGASRRTSVAVDEGAVAVATEGRSLLANKTRSGRSTVAKLQRRIIIAPREHSDRYVQATDDSGEGKRAGRNDASWPLLETWS